MTRSIFQTLLVAAILVFALTACESQDPPAEPVDDSTAQVTEPVAIPAGLFVSDAPTGAIPLIEAKTAATKGERVVFQARVGGRVDAFVDERAVFFVADPALLSCDQLHGDACKTPWDYCCEEQSSLRANMATVQVVDADGRPLKISLEGEHGLAPLQTVVISGIVDQVDEEGNFVVNADMLHVAES